jgi:hypothetical protein
VDGKIGLPLKHGSLNLFDEDPLTAKFVQRLRQIRISRRLDDNEIHDHAALACPQAIGNPLGLSEGEG